MAVTVETLEKLERKMTLTLPVNAIQSEVESRLKKLSRTVKADGFRPGKVPMSVVAQRYGYSVQYEVMNDKVGEAFAAAANEAKLRVAGQPKITEKDGAPEGELTFDAVFEVYPGGQELGDLAAAPKSKKVSTGVDIDAAHRPHARHPAQAATHLRTARRTTLARRRGDRVTVDFEGKIDGETFSGGKADDFQFMVGEGQMLKEFEDATCMRYEDRREQDLLPTGISRPTTTARTWPERRPTSMVTVKKIEAAHLPEDHRSLRQVAGHRRTRPRRRSARRHPQEPGARGQRFRLMARNKQAAMDALAEPRPISTCPRSRCVQAEVDRMIEGARADLKQRGIKDADKAPIPRGHRSVRRPSAACAWAWWWPSWCGRP